MEEGYIKLHRSLLDSQAFQNKDLLKVWIWCLLRANYKERWVSIKTGKGFSEVHVMPGQFIYGRDSASLQLRMKPSSVHDRMKKLAKMQNIVIQPDRQYSIITVVNWEGYQGKDDDEQQSTQQPSNRQPTGNQQASDTDKKDKKDKNIYIAEIVDYLNQKSGKKFLPKTKAVISHINARLSEGRTIEDFKRVIDTKVTQWINDSDMQKYIRPETLFGTKFESYLNEKPIQQSNGGFAQAWPIK